MPADERHSTEFVALGAMPMRVLQNAYTAAIQRRAATVGTIDVLVQAAIYEKRTPPWLLAGPRAHLMRMVAEPHRMPAKRSRGELASGPVSDLDPEVLATFREIEWRVRRMAGRLSPVKESDVHQWDRRPGWTAATRGMLAGTLVAARDNGIPFAGLTHLMFAMLRTPDCDGTRYLFPYESTRVAAVERLAKEPNLRRPDQPHPDLDELRTTMWLRSRPLLGRLAGRVFAGMSRLTRIGPLLHVVEPEARRQAVRLGHGVVGPRHTLLAILAVDTALDVTRIPVPARHSSRNRAAFVLRAHGVDAGPLRQQAALHDPPEDPPAELLTQQLAHLRAGDPFESAETVAAATRAMELSLAYRHPDTGTGHLLLALIENDTGEAAAVLRDLNVDPAAVRERVEKDLRPAPAAWPSGASDL
jgi:hypothetical protein